MPEENTPKNLEEENKMLHSQLELALKELDSKNALIKELQSKLGRKKRFSNLERQTIQMYRIQGLKIKEIAAMYNCSVGTIHNIINEKL